jgi:RimJ/RimL family protein N-acetyltransferase
VIDQLETERLTLRPLTLDDIEPLVTLNSDPEVMRYINGGRASTRAEVAETVRESLGHRWMAFERSTGELVGWFSLVPSADRPDERELGYRLRRAMWKQGFAIEGSRALVDLAFTDLGVRRVWAQTMTVNAASRRVMEGCGLRYVRTFHLDWPEPIAGSELGDVEYELLKPDWEAG